MAEDIISTTPGTNAIPETTAVPTGFPFLVKLRVSIFDVAGTPRNQQFLVTSLAQTDATPSTVNYTIRLLAQLLATGEEIDSAIGQWWTDTSAQVRFRLSGTSDGNVGLVGQTLGWIDPRVS